MIGLVLIFSIVPFGFIIHSTHPYFFPIFSKSARCVFLCLYRCFYFWDICMPRNLPVSNKRDSKENSCIHLGAGWFTIWQKLLLWFNLIVWSEYRLLSWNKKWVLLRLELLYGQESWREMKKGDYEYMNLLLEAIQC